MNIDDKLKDVLKDKPIDNVIECCGYLINAGYSSLDAFTNALVLYPDKLIPTGVIEIISVVIDGDNGTEFGYKFSILKTEDTELLKFANFLIEDDHELTGVIDNVVTLVVDEYRVHRYILSLLEEAGKRVQTDEYPDDNILQLVFGINPPENMIVNEDAEAILGEMDEDDEPVEDGGYENDWTNPIGDYGDEVVVREMDTNGNTRTYRRYNRRDGTVSDEILF